MSERAKRFYRDQSGKLRIKQDRAAARLVMEDGTVLEGLSFGASGRSFGELVFNTSLMGYQEVLTDPSYAGQVITMTYPEMGNYGANAEDLESKKVFARGLVVRHLSRLHSNFRAQESLEAFMQRHGVVGISEVDTRHITRKLRDQGAMRCLITNLEEDLAADTAKLTKLVKDSPEMTGQDLTAEVTTDKVYKLGQGNKLKVSVLDFGCKANILNELTKRDIEVTVYPAQTAAKAVLETKPDGIFLSNGPGDPAACAAVLKELPQLIESKIPIFGICLGHQLLSIAMGASTYKLKFGHRGGNQPVKDLTTGKIEVTSQNHGFAVDDKSLPEHLELTHINLNDNSVEGFRHRTLPIFAVQYHPESSPGPHDSTYLFDRFVSLMSGAVKAAK
ncbi:MAG: glutamine-hydrolyzing carbamoyl-phosphate synthase small subunit [Candidatus Obscuribacter phosphatis]|uniref:Carbamoyl phosphate synthase small chain n=1 Tax=Candidatus Obscuribacter phosphatis TaxID=1906157 RepID=A0A8J7TP62_9BACT|nr:glutamine-hydrolyzing carbamoyl-phosphate synthase small subunit [Candidatus Obscuribacter phosphatis]